MKAEREYHLRRADQEREWASKAKNKVAAEAHRKIAGEHEALAERLEVPPPD